MRPCQTLRAPINDNQTLKLTDMWQGNWEYTGTKYALRGFMRTVRRSSHEQSIRINYVAPCWIKSAIRTAEYEKWLVDRGVEFGEQKDVSSCMLRIATDRSINGEYKRCRCVGKNANGHHRSLFDDHTPLHCKGGFRRY
jgi:hypothetical protein